MLKKSIHPQMDRIVKTLDLTSSDLCELSQLSSFYKTRIAKNYNKFPIDGIFCLADKLGVDFDQLLDGKIDYDALKEHFSGNYSYLPTRYRTYQKSKMATIHNFFEYTKKRIPSYQVKKMMLKLQIRPEVFSERNRSVSGLLLMDLFKEAAIYNKNLFSFFELGGKLCQKHTIQVKKDLNLNHFQRPEKIYEAFIENIGNEVEQNMEYKILRSTGRMIVIGARTREETKDCLKIDKFGCEGHYQNILGYYQEILKNFYSKAPEVKRLSSYRKVNNYDLLFEVNYSHLQKSQLYF